MGLSAIIGNPGQVLNRVVQVGSDYFADFVPDSDTAGVSSSFLGLLDDVSAPPPETDILRGEFSVPAGYFELQDKDGLISSWYESNTTKIFNLGMYVTVWIGGVGASQAFPADYVKVATMRIKNGSKRANLWRFNCVSILENLVQTAFDHVTALNGSLASGSATITVDGTANFPAAGYIKIESEFVQYTGVSSTTFTGCTRGALGSTASAHPDNAAVNRVQQLIGNPVDLALNLMVSLGGGSAYDVLADGAGLNQALVDIATFESVGAAFDVYPFTTYFSNQDVRDFVVRELLLPCGLRLIIKSGIISVVAIDNYSPGTGSLQLDETIVKETPELIPDADKIVNRISVFWDFQQGDDTFASNSTLNDTASQNFYQIRALPPISFRSTITLGSSLISSTFNSLITRFSSPVSEIDVEANRSAFFVNLGDTVRLIHAYVPQPGGSLGHDAYMEVYGLEHVLSKGSLKGTVRIKLQYPSSFGYRGGIIAPSPLIASITSQSVFNVPTGQGAFYQAGYGLRLWKSGAYLSDAVRTIVSVSGDQLTVTPAWTTTLDTNTRLKFADYDDSSTDQRKLYAYITGDVAENTQVTAADSYGVPQDLYAGLNGVGVQVAVLAYDSRNPQNFSDGQLPFQILP